MSKRWGPSLGLTHLRGFVRDEKHDIRKYGKAKVRLLCVEGRKIAASAQRDERKHRRRWQRLLNKRLAMQRRHLLQ